MFQIGITHVESSRQLLYLIRIDCFVDCESVLSSLSFVFHVRFVKLCRIVPLSLGPWNVWFLSVGFFAIVSNLWKFKQFWFKILLDVDPTVNGVLLLHHFNCHLSANVVVRNPFQSVEDREFGVVDLIYLKPSDTQA